jgi:hypothetical protein
MGSFHVDVILKLSLGRHTKFTHVLDMLLSFLVET